MAIVEDLLFSSGDDIQVNWSLSTNASLVGMSLQFQLYDWVSKAVLLTRSTGAATITIVSTVASWAVLWADAVSLTLNGNSVYTFGYNVRRTDHPSAGLLSRGRWFYSQQP